MLDYLFFKLLKWWCERRLDQWERWRIKTKYGYVYVQIDREGDEYNWDDLK